MSKREYSEVKLEKVKEEKSSSSKQSKREHSEVKLENVKRHKSSPCLTLSTVAPKAEIQNHYSLDEIMSSLGVLCTIRTVLSWDTILDARDFARMASVNWFWFMVFHGESNVWVDLATMYVGLNKKDKWYGARFTFLYPFVEAHYGPDRCPGNFIYRLNQGLLSTCHRCGMDLEMQGVGNLTLSAYHQLNGKYRCVNPKCGRVLRRKVCGLPLADAFTACRLSGVSKVKKHAWVSLDGELFAPDSKTVIIDRSYDYCKRCGLLNDTTGDSEDDEYCIKCLANPCACTPCDLCELLPVDCKCDPCTECDLCTGCPTCLTFCKCKFCLTCDMLLDECECSSFYEF